MSGTSIYLFDIDDNILFLDTPIVLRNTETREEHEVSTGQFAAIHHQLGHPSQWQDFSIFDASFRHFRDLPADQLAPHTEQRFVRDIRAAINKGDDAWRGPAWDVLCYACDRQRPVGFVTARGHEPETIKAGITALVEAKLLPQEPNYLGVFPVSNDGVRSALADHDLDLTVPVLKKRAILEVINEAERTFADGGSNRYGMSDDDPANVNLIIQAMAEAKRHHPDSRFFVVNTHQGQRVKLEIFPYDMPVVGKPGHLLSA